MHRPRGRQRTKFPDERFQIETIEQLYRVVERAVASEAEIEHANGMGRCERGSGVRFAFEAAQRGGRLRAGTEHVGRDQLDRGVPREEAMPRAPHLAHSALAQQLDELVAAECSRRTNLAAAPAEEY